MRKRLPTPLGSLILSLVTLCALFNHLSCSSASAKQKSQLPNATVGVYYSATIPPGNASWKLVSGSLPPGLTLAGAILAGTPSVSGQYGFAAANTNGNGGNNAASSLSNFSIAVLPSNQLSVTTSSLAAGTVGVNYSDTLTATGGTQPYGWLVTSGSLPAGLALSIGSGTISGTPTRAGTFSFTIEVQDSSSPPLSATANLSIVVAAGALSITTTSLPGGTTGVAYQAILAATGGTVPYSWGLISGQLPAGLALSTGGIISGTPTASGQFSLTIQVVDSAQQSASQAFTIAISQGSPGTLQITPSSLPSGSVGAAYQATLTATGGTSPYSWVVSSGQIPPGLSLNTATGTISGSPSQSGSYAFVIQAADSSSPQLTGSQSYTISITSGATLDQYGGRNDVTCAGGAKGSFYKEKISNRWWFCTPAGHGMFLQAVYEVDYSAVDGNDPQGVNGKTNIANKYSVGAPGGDWIVNWAPGTLNRLQGWGFNGIINSNLNLWPNATDNNYATTDRTIPVKVPFIHNVKPGVNAMRNVSVDLYGGGTTQFLTDPVKNFLEAATPVYNSLVINYRGWNIADWYDSKIWTWLNSDMAQDWTWQTILHSSYAQWLVGITCEDADNSAGFQAGDAFPTNPPNSGNPHLGWLTATMSPNMVAGQDSAGVNHVYIDTFMHTKSAWHDFLVGKYSTISALNTAWGSNYTTFGSTGISVTGESLGAGDGTTTTFSKTLTHANPSPYTVAVLVNGIVVGGDCPQWTYKCSAPVGHGSFFGTSTVSGGDINYSTGVLTVTFASPPQNGTPITLNYIYGGWGAGGTGLLDEDARSVDTWIGNDDESLSNSASAVAADMNTFLGNLATEFYSNCSSGIKSVFPNVMFLGPDSQFTWNVPSRGPVLAAAGAYVDAMLGSSSVPFTQNEINYVYSYAGDVPLIEGIYLHSNPDSPFNQQSNGSAANADEGTQERKGAQIYSFLSTDLSMAYPNGSYPYIGYVYWDYFDSWGELKNWGLVSWRDNAYDGREDIYGSVTCSGPLSVFTCGGEDSTPYPTWQPGHSYLAQTSRVIVAVNGTAYYFEAETNGSSGTSQPNWPTALNSTVADGTVTWMNVGVKTNPSGYGDAITQVKAANALWLR